MKSRYLDVECYCATRKETSVWGKLVTRIAFGITYFIEVTDVADIWLFGAFYGGYCQRVANRLPRRYRISTCSMSSPRDARRRPLSETGVNPLLLIILALLTAGVSAS